MITLRPYQSEAVEKIREAFKEHSRVLFVLSTGGGKTRIFTYIAQAVMKKGNRVLIIAHRREIIDQISDALKEMGVNHGMIAPGIRMTHDDVQVGMVQTIANRLTKIMEPDIIIQDESHHIVCKSNMKVLDFFNKAKVLGVTATPQRLDNRGLGIVFSILTEGPKMRWLIENGFLCKYEYYAPPENIKLEEFHTRGGDYAIDEIEKAMDKASITGDAVKHYEKYLNGRPAIIFCTTVKHSEHVRDNFLASGWRAESIDGKMTSLERRRKISDLGNGKLHVLTSCMVLTEGVDVPICSGCIILRPTKSLSLFLQMVGRVLRPKPDESNAIILDHAGVVRNFGLPDEPRAWTLEGKLKGPKKSPTQCKRCYKVFYTKPPCEDSECPIGKSEGGGRANPEEREGELQAMEDPYAWAKGIDIAFAKGDEWRALLHHAEGKVERLRQIQKIRGYKWQWIKNIMGDHSSQRFRKK